MTAYVGEIRIFAGNFAPAGWMFCEGQLLAISEYDTLFTLIGTTYGGDGQSTFALPDLRGRLPLHQGTNPTTGTTFQLAQTGGAESVTLTTNQIPTHSHALMATSSLATQQNVQDNVLAEATLFDPYLNANPTSAMAPQAVGTAGGSQPHENFQPYLCVDFIISLFGIFPSPT